MKYAAWLVCSAAAAAVAVVLFVQLSSATAADQARGGLPPLTIDRGAPLLLDESETNAAEKKADARKVLADNQSCYVCHANYQEEEMVHQHAVGDIGCIQCHGPSLAHRNDENNTTPPDKMYPTAAIDKSCAECHDTHDVSAQKVLTRWRERCAEKADPAKIVCTDCHGYHRLKVRTVRWDKATGKLLMTNSKADKKTEQSSE